MKKKEKKNGKNVVVEDGHAASFRDIAGNLKNIYADDGSLTEEGKKVMSAREHLAKILNESEDESKTSARNRIFIISAVLIVAIVLFFLFFHISLLNVRARESYDFKIYLKSKPTFSNTFITHDKIKALLDKYDNASESERILIYNDPFVRLLLDKHILDDYHNTKQLLHDENINDVSREQVIQISATALYDAYNSNAAAADNKYTGKTLIVTGYVFEITKNYDGIYFVILDNKGADGFSSTFCYFPASRNSSLTSLQKGQFLSIKGKCIGRGTDNIFPKLENCTLEGNFIQENYEETNQHELLNEQTEYYNHIYDGESGEQGTFETKIIFGKKEIKMIAPNETATFIIMGNPEKEATPDGGFNIKYNVYNSEDTDRDMTTITRYKDRVKIVFDAGESNAYVIIKK